MLERFTREEVRARVASRLPLGAIPVIRYYDEGGQVFGHITLRNLQEIIVTLGIENRSLSASLARASGSSLSGSDRTGRHVPCFMAVRTA